MKSKIVLDAVPVGHINRLGIHFAFRDENILPNSVMLGLAPSSRPERPCGRSLIVAKRVQINSCLPGIVQVGLCDVACESHWIQCPNRKQDVYKVHFTFVPKHRRDNFAAMKHDSANCRHSFTQLAQTSWDVVVWNNGDGQFDISCTRPQISRSQNILFFDRGVLRCAG